MRRWAMAGFDVVEHPGGDVVLWVFVQPGATRSMVVGPYLDSLRLKVSAPADQGKANDAVRALLATTFGVPRNTVRIELGQTSRRKRVRVVGIEIAPARDALSRWLPADAG